MKQYSNYEILNEDDGVELSDIMIRTRELAEDEMIVTPAESDAYGEQMNISDLFGDVYFFTRNHSVCGVRLPA